MTRDENAPALHLDIAVLGGGFAGVFCARELGRRLGRRPGLRIGIISEENYMVFQPMLAEVVGGELSPRHVINPIRQLCRGVDVYKARVEAADVKRRELRLNTGHFTHDLTVRYGHLVLALGAEIDLSRVPGMPEHGWLMQNVGDAMRLRAQVISRCEEANLTPSPAARRTLMTFVVVGGGYSGVETAGQIMDMLLSIRKFYHQIQPSDIRVFLVHSGEHILPTLTPKLGVYAETILRKHGVQLLLQRRVKAVTAQQVYLDNGESIDTHTVVCTVGNAPNRLIRAMCEQGGWEQDHSKPVTDEFFRVKGADRVWAAGDCARVPMEDGKPCPPTAQFAYRQGILCGRNIVATLDGGQPKPFRFTGLGELATIGRHRAVASVGGVQLSGFLAWWLWRTVYLLKLPGFERKLRVVLEWTVDLFFSRDFNLLNPRGTQVLTNVHVEKGDRLFNAGEPPFSLYVLISGRIDLFEKGRLVKSVGPGEFFGERALTKNLPYIYDAVAAESSELMTLDGRVFRRLVGGSDVLRRVFRSTGSQYKTLAEMDKLRARVDPAVAARTAGEVMQTQLACLRQDMSIQEALAAIRARRHSSYPVLRPDGTCAGVLFREDLFQIIKSSSTALTERITCLDLRTMPLVETSCRAGDLLDLMLTRGSNKVLVQEPGGKLAGIVTLLDLIPDAKSADASLAARD